MSARRSRVGRRSEPRPAAATPPPPTRPEPGPGSPARSGPPQRNPLPGPGPRAGAPVPDPKGPDLRVVLVSRDNMLAGALRSLIVTPGGVRMLDWHSQELEAAIRHADVVIIDMPPNFHERTFAVIDGRFLGRVVVLLQEGEHAEALPPGPPRVVLYRPLQIGELWSAIAGATPPSTDQEPSGTGVEPGEPEVEVQEPGVEPGEPGEARGESEEPEAGGEPGRLGVGRAAPDETGAEPAREPAVAADARVEEAGDAADVEQPAQGLPFAESGRLIGLSGRELEPTIGPGQVAPGMDEATLERLHRWRSSDRQLPPARSTPPQQRRSSPAREEARAGRAEARRTARAEARAARSARAEARREQSLQAKAARAEARQAARAEAARAKAAAAEARQAERAARAEARKAAREESRRAKAAEAEARRAAQEESRRAEAAEAEARKAAEEESRRAKAAEAEARQAERAAQAEAQKAEREESLRVQAAEAEARKAEREAEAAARKAARAASRQQKAVQEAARREEAAQAKAERAEARRAARVEAAQGRAARAQARKATRAESRQARAEKAQVRRAARAEARRASAAKAQERREQARQASAARSQARQAARAEARQARAARAEERKAARAEARQARAVRAEQRRAAWAAKAEQRKAARVEAAQARAARAGQRKAARAETRQARAAKADQRRAAAREAYRARLAEAEVRKAAEAEARQARAAEAAAKRAESQQARAARAEARQAARAEARSARAAKAEVRRAEARQARATRAEARKEARAEAAQGRAARAEARRAARAEAGQARAARAEARKVARDEARQARAARAEERGAARAEAGQARAEARKVARGEARQARAARAEARQVARGEAQQARAARAEARKVTRGEARQVWGRRVKEARRVLVGREAAGLVGVGRGVRAGVGGLARPVAVVVLLAAVGLVAAGWRAGGGPDTLAGEVATVRAGGSAEGGLVAQDPRAGPIEPVHALAVGAWLRASEAGDSIEAAVRAARAPSRWMLAAAVALTVLLSLLPMRVGPGTGAAAGPGPAPPQPADRSATFRRLAVAAVAGALVALDPLLVRGGRAATGTVLALALALAALALAWAVPSRPVLRWLPAVGAAGGLALLVSPLALPVLAVPTVAALLEARYQEAWRTTAALGLAVTLWLLLPVWVAGQDLGAGQAGWLLGRPPGRGSLAASPLSWLLVAAGLVAAFLTWRPRSGARPAAAATQAARRLAWAAVTTGGALAAMALGYPVDRALPFAVPAAAVAVAFATGAAVAAAGSPRARRMVLAGAGVVLAGLLVAQGVDWGSRYGGRADDGLGRLVATVAAQVPACSAVNAAGPDDRARLLAAGVAVTDFASGPAAHAAGVRYFVLTGDTGSGPARPDLAAWVRQRGVRLAGLPSRSFPRVELWRVDAAPLDPVADHLQVPGGSFSNVAGSACGGYRVVDRPEGTFHAGYVAAGGKAVLGRPLGSVWTSDGPALQAFDTMVLGAAPGTGGPPAVRPIELPPLLAKLNAEAVADANIPLPSTRPPTTDRQARALLEDRMIARAYLGADPARASAEDWRRARERFGRPLGRPQVMPDGAVRQPFERVVLELPADGSAARPAALGRLAVRLGLVPRQATRLEPVPGLPAGPAPTRLDPAPLVRWVAILTAALALAGGLAALAARRRRRADAGGGEPGR